MKETLKVSIAGIGFTIETEAFARLKEYLDSWENNLSAEDDPQEVMGDIEARIVELILDCQDTSQPVTLGAIENILIQMGQPEEISERTSGEGRRDESKTSFPRRLYRNPDGQKIGGVCSGLATYFNVDPVWIRVGFFAPLILSILLPTMYLSFLTGFAGSLFGAFVLLYFILWISIPKAVTPRQRLEMEGKRVDAAGIRETPSYREAESKSGSVFGELLSVLGKIIIFFVKAMVLMIGVLCAFVALMLVVGLFTGASITGYAFDMPTIMFGNLDGISLRAFTGLLVAIVFIPLAVLAYCLISVVFKNRINKTVVWTLVGIWIVLFAVRMSYTVSNWHNIRGNVRTWVNSQPWGGEKQFTDGHKLIEITDGKSSVRISTGAPADPVAIPGDTLSTATPSQSDSITVILTEPNDQQDGNNL